MSALQQHRIFDVVCLADKYFSCVLVTHKKLLPKLTDVPNLYVH